MITIIIYLFAVALAIPTGKPEATGSTRRLMALEPTKYTLLVEGSVCRSGWVGGSDGETQQGCEQLCTDHEDCGTYCHSPTTLPGQDFECLMYSRCDNFVKNFGPGGASAETFSCFTKNLDQCPSSFLCTRNAAIYGHNKEQLTDVTVEDCKVACCSRDWCESFDYHKHSQKCDLSERVALEVGGLKTDYSGNPYDHYSLPDRCPSLFLHARNAAIQGHNKEQLTDVTVEDCKAACCSRDWCKSFDYYKLSQKCDLSEGIALEVGGLKRDYFGNPFDHYSLPPACITGTFKTNEGFEKTMAPYRVGNVFVFGVRERTWFKMASVDLDGNFIECRHHSKSMTESMTDSQRADIWNDANKGGEYSVHSVKSCTQGF